MVALNSHRPELAELVFVATRRSQAAAVELADRLARSSSTGAPRLLGRLWRLQLEAAAVLSGEPAVLADRAYAALERSVALNRQFAQRLLEAIDIRDHTWPAPDAKLAPVTRLVPRKHG